MKLIINPATGLLEPSPSVTGFLTKALADTYYYPLSTNPAGYKTFNNIDGGFANSIYLTAQLIDGGGA